MQNTDNYVKRTIFDIKPKLSEILIYLPGAAIILYGFWLALTV